MSDITSILTIMSPGGLVCGTLLELRGDVMEFEISADLPRGFESDWRMELRGTVESARGRLRVDDVRPRRDGLPRYGATIVNVRDADRALFDSWRRRGTAQAAPLRVEDPLAVTTRTASARETEWALRRMDSRKTMLGAASLVRTQLWATPAVAPPVAAAPVAAPAGSSSMSLQGALATMPQAARSGTPSVARMDARSTPAVTPAARMDTPRPSARPESSRPELARTEPVRAPSAPAGTTWVEARPSTSHPGTAHRGAAHPGAAHPGNVHRRVERVLPESSPDVGLRRTALPVRDSSAPAQVHFKVETRPDAPTLFTAAYVAPLRYRTDWRDQVQWGAILIEIPRAAPVGADVELRIVTPDGREICVPAQVLTASVRSTCLALTMSEADKLRIQG